MSLSTDKNYVLGRGRIYIELIDNVTKLKTGGERYFGNAPQLATSSSADTLDHFSSEGGIKVKDKSVDLQYNRTGSFTGDNISDENVALFNSGTVTALTQTAQTGVVQTLKAYKDRWIQLGTSTANPSGLRNLASLVVTTTGGSPVTIAATEYTIDYAKGRVYIKPTAAGVTEGMDLLFTYNTVATTRNRIVSANQSIYAAIRFISDNATGDNKDYFIPYAKLSANGDFNLIGDEWQQMQFNMEILKLDDLTESMYIDGRAVV